MKHQKLMDKAVNAFIHMAANPSKETAYRTVCLTRASAVHVIDEYVQTQESRRQFNHMARKMPVPELPENVTVSIMNPYEPHEKILHSRIVELGEMLFNALDIWQTCGANLNDLKTLCNSGGEHWYRAVADDERGEKFSSITFACNPDYKDTGDILETTPNAPLTTCLKEFMIHQLRHTEHGRKAAHEAMEKFFPELFENALYQYTDSDGTVHYLDKDGVEVGHEPPKK